MGRGVKDLGNLGPTRGFWEEGIKYKGGSEMRVILISSKYFIFKTGKVFMHSF